MTDAVALYLRVSTPDQDLAGQERELRSYAESRGWTIAEVYSEKASARGEVARAEYLRLLRDAAAPDREWKRVVVWALDRWSRDPSFVQAVGSIEELERRGIRFHSLREPTLDSGEDGTPSLGRDVLRAILPAIAAFESRRRSERTRLALGEIRAGRRRTRTGNPPGRPQLWSAELWTRITKLRSEVDPATGRQLRWAEVAQRVHIPAGTLRKWHSALRRQTPRAIKRPDGFGALSSVPSAGTPLPGRD